MGTTSSAQRVGLCEADAVADEQNTGPIEKNGQDSGMTDKNENQSEELNGHCEERVLQYVESVVVTLKEDGTMTEELHDYVSEANAANLGKEIVNAHGMTTKEKNECDSKVNDVEVGFKKVFRFVGFKFTVKKDKCDTTALEEPLINEKNAKVTIPSKRSKVTTKKSSVCVRENDEEEMQKEPIRDEVSVSEWKNSDLSSDTHSEMPIGQISEITDYNEQIISDKELVKEIPSSLEPEEPMSPVKRFFTQGIWASLRKRRKEEESKINDKQEDEKCDRTTQEAGTCVCLDVFNIALEEGKDLQAIDEGMPAAEGAVMNLQEQGKVQDSPFRRIFRPFSTRRQKETKPQETHLNKSREYPIGNLQSYTELIKVQEEENEPKVEQPRSVEEQLTVRSEGSKKKLDSTVSWETLLCGGSIKKSSRKTSNSEDDTQNKVEDPRKTTESPLGSSTEGDYEHLTSNEQADSPAEGECGSKWKSLKKLVTPKRKARTEETGSPEQIQSDSEFAKDESSCSIKKLIPRRKKRKFNGWQEHSSSDEVGKGTASDTEDDETPLVVPLSEYEITEPECLKEITEKTVENAIEKEIQTMNEEDKFKETKLPMTPLYIAGPSVIPIPSIYVEDLTEFISKHQQLSDIPEEGFSEGTVQTPVSSAEWTTQDDTLAEDIVDLTADAVTAHEEFDSEFTKDESTEMVSAVSHLTESPKTSRNITPALSKYDLTDPDLMLQEAVETICKNQGVLPFRTTERIPEALADSVCPCFVESTVSGRTNVLFAHEKMEGTPIYIGHVSQEDKAVEFISLALVEGTPETNEALPTKFVFEEKPEAVGTAKNKEYEAEVSEVELELHEALLDGNTPFDETAKKAEIPIIMYTDLFEESRKNETANVEQVEEKMEKYPTEVLNGNQELKSVVVKSSMQDEFQPAKKQFITKNTNTPESEGPLDTAVEQAVYEQGQYAEILVEGEKELKIPDFELSAIDTKQVAEAEVEFAGKRRQSLTNTRAVSQPKREKDSELCTDTYTNEAAPESVEEESPMTQEIKRAYVDAEAMIPDTQLKNMPETMEKTAKSETNSEIATETQVIAETSSPKSGTKQLQKEVESETESRPQFCKEDKQVVKVTETISDISIIYVGEINHSKVDSPVKEHNETEDTCELDKYTAAKPEEESEISEESVSTPQRFEEKVQLVVKQEPEALFTPQPSDFCEPVETKSGITEVCDVVCKQKSEIIVGSGKHSYSPDVAKHEITELQFEKTAVSEAETTESAGQVTEPMFVKNKRKTLTITELQVEKHIKTQTIMEIQEELTTINSEAETVQSAEQVTEQILVKHKSKTLTIIEPQVEQQVMSELKVETVEVTSVATDVKVELVTDVQIETPFLTSVPKILDSVPPAEMSVIKDTKVQSHFLTLNKEPGIVAEMAAVVLDSQTATMAVVAQPPAVFQVLKEAEILAETPKEKDAHVKTPVADEVKELTLEMPVAAQTSVQASVVMELREQTPSVTSALETKTLMRTHVEKSFHSQNTLMTLVKEVGPRVMTAAGNEPQLRGVVFPVEQRSVVLLVQEPEMLTVAQELKETKLETSGATDISAPKTETSVVTEQILETSDVTKPEVKTLVVTMTEVTPVKDEVWSSVTTSVVEEQVKPQTVAVGIHTLTMVPALVHLPMNETDTVVNGIETAVLSPEEMEKQHEASFEAKIDVKLPFLTEDKLKGTEMIRQVSDEAQSSDSKGDTKCLKTVRKVLEEIHVPMAKTTKPLPEGEDDTWKDVIENIRDVFSITEAGCHGHK